MIDLVTLGTPSQEIEWSAGATHSIGPEPHRVAERLPQVARASSAALLFLWDVELGTPDEALV